jgi:hypothetical protein
MNSLIERNLPTWKINDPTKVTEHYACNRKYFYAYVLGWRPEGVNNHLVFGSSYHVSQEYLLSHDYSVQSVVKAHEAFVTDYRSHLGPETDEMYKPKTPDNALIVLNAYAKQYQKDLDLWEPLYTEIAGKVNLTDDQVLYFRMDSILRHKQKETIKSIEHKTGSSTYNWELQWPLSMQNGTYSHVLNCLFHPDIVEGVTFRGSIFKKVKKAWEQLANNQKLTYAAPYDFIEYPAKKSVDQMQTWLWNTTYELDKLNHNFELLADAREDDPVLFAFPFNPTSCADYFGCEYIDFCQAWQNPLQRCSEPPLGFKEEHWNPMAKPAKHKFEIGGKDAEGIQ